MPKLKRGASRVKSAAKKKNKRKNFFESMTEFKKSRKLMNKVAKK